MDTNRKELSMRKQYRIVEGRWPYYELVLYHDGIKVETRDSNQMVIGHDTDKLAEEGYTYGYTDEEIEMARERYERKRANRIGPEEEVYDGEWVEIGVAIYECSVCGHIIYGLVGAINENNKCCGHCGAKMKEIK